MRWFDKAEERKWAKYREAQAEQDRLAEESAKARFPQFVDYKYRSYDNRLRRPIDFINDCNLLIRLGNGQSGETYGAVNRVLTNTIYHIMPTGVIDSNLEIRILMHRVRHGYTGSYNNGMPGGTASIPLSFTNNPFYKIKLTQNNTIVYDDLGHRDPRIIYPGPWMKYLAERCLMTADYLAGQYKKGLLPEQIKAEEQKRQGEATKAERQQAEAQRLAQEHTRAQLVRNTRMQP